ncbi:MAG: hypothetical protein A2X23_05200 [Chloroflexi bacterium GWC2_73_18]|nr:MAG: hypothetical protein A2X23_05200 [Chloroflexi bacterium GWC2_73_18]
MTVPTLIRRSAGNDRSPRRTLGQVGSFTLIGVGSTLAYVALYALLRAVSPAAAANAAALVVTALGNTAANRRLTFRVRGRDRLARDHAAGLAAFGAALAITSASLAVLDLAIPDPSRTAEITLLVAANAAATLVRFLLLRLALDRTRPIGLTARPPRPPSAVPVLERIAR